MTDRHYSTAMLAGGYLVVVGVAILARAQAARSTARALDSAALSARVRTIVHDELVYQRDLEKDEREADEP